jgi:hypothetical protein
VRSLLLAIAVVALAATCAQLARAEGEAPPAAVGSVTLVPSDGGAPRTLALADLAAQQDVHDARYALRAADGATSTVTVAAGVSLTALLRAAGLEEDEFTYVEIARPDGSSVLVLRDDLPGPDEGPPVVWVDAEGVHLLRPSKGEGDPNGADLVTLPPGGTLTADLRTGDPLAARISASALRAQPDEAIDFSAALVAGALGAGMSFQWYFDDNRFATGASVTHRFRKAGRYTVLLNIVRGGDAIGSPAVVVVRIARPASERDPRDARGSGEGQGGGGDGGTNGSGGGGGGGGGGGTGTGSSEGGGGGTAPTAPAPSVPAYTPVPAAPAPTPAPAPAPTPAPAAPKGDVVSGTLLAATDVPLPAADGARQSPSAREDAPSDPLQIPIGIWIAVGLAAVVALGWTLESRHTLPFWQP